MFLVCTEFCVDVWGFTVSFVFYRIEPCFTASTDFLWSPPNCRSPSCSAEDRPFHLRPAPRLLLFLFAPSPLGFLLFFPRFPLFFFRVAFFFVFSVALPFSLPSSPLHFLSNPSTFIPFPPHSILTFRFFFHFFLTNSGCFLSAVRCSVFLFFATTATGVYRVLPGFLFGVTQP